MRGRIDQFAHLGDVTGFIGGMRVMLDEAMRSERALKCAIAEMYVQGVYVF